MQYYTALENTNGRYTGIVYNSINNSVEYRSNSHSDQIQAMLEVQNFLKEKQISNEGKARQQILTSSKTYGTPGPISSNRETPTTTRKCCGR